MFKIRQRITCKSRNIIYLVTCAKCKSQGVGHSTQFAKRISNYFSLIKSATRDCVPNANHKVLDTVPNLRKEFQIILALSRVQHVTEKYHVTS